LRHEIEQAFGFSLFVHFPRVNIKLNIFLPKEIVNST